MAKFASMIPAERAGRMVFVLFVLVVLTIAWTHGLRGGDDMMYRDALRDKRLFEYVAHRYQIWSGRFLIDSTTVAMVQSVMLWRVVTTAMTALLFGMLAYYLGAVRRPLQMAMLCAGLFLIDAEVARPAFWWMTGSFNYAWPLALATVALLPFSRPDLPRRVFLLTVPAAVYACNHEQVGLLLLGLETVLAVWWWRQGRLRGLHLVQMAVGVVSLLTVLLAPGTSSRFGVHTTYWFPQYLQLDLVERVFSGFQLAFGHVFAAGNAVTFLLALALLGVVWLRTRDLVDRALAVAPVLLFSLPMVAQLVGPGRTEATRLLEIANFPAGRTGRDRFEEFWIGVAGNAVEPMLYLHFLFCCVGTLCIGMGLYRAMAHDARWGRGLAPLLWAAGICSTAMVGMSPSLYASGARIFFFQDMLSLVLLCAVMVQLPNRSVRWLLLLAALPLAGVGLRAAIGTP
ncbi:DUF6056 family protein [Xylophilus sp. Leaf220]|uniref:DUF6056 family protein n=1 Tax=Xylophilus sp. Leaf220 TaxID=1735686 RepID=UPI0007127DCD|nr:DUF6056 family protein [Xylophilus sp. Leaf220]KQM80354.1 hypothetical protein ASE76_04250 [Xylophilus sp. Leaf220]